jgi:MATE family multidrug resistance protein
MSAPVTSPTHTPRHLLRDLVKLGWPVFVAQLAVVANGLIDTLMAGRHGTDDLAAVGIGNAIFFSVFGPLMGMQIAITPIAARLYGAGRYQDIGEKVRQGMYFSLALAVIAFVLFRFPKPFLDLTQAAPEVQSRIRDYLGYIAWGIPSALLFRLFYSYSTAVSRPRMVMAFNLAGVAFKVPLNWIFLDGHLGAPAMGAGGCALASTIISWGVCLAAWGWVAWDAEYRRYAVFARWSRPDVRALWEIVSLGVPIGVTFFVDVTAFTFMSIFIARLGAATSAAQQIAANLAALLFMLPLALGNAASVLVGQALGAHDYPRARATGVAGLGLGFGVAICMAVLLITCAPYIAALYSIDATVRETAATLIRLVAGYHLFDAVQAVVVNVLRGYKRAVVPMVIYAVGLWALGLAGGYALALTPADLNLLGISTPMGAPGFWTGAIIGMCTASLTVAGYFLYVSAPKRVLLAERPAGA